MHIPMFIELLVLLLSADGPQLRTEHVKSTHQQPSFSRIRNAAGLVIQFSFLTQLSHCGSMGPY